MAKTIKMYQGGCTSHSCSADSPVIRLNKEDAMDDAQKLYQKCDHVQADFCCCGVIELDCEVKT